jgi:hypothetical protein
MRDRSWIAALTGIAFVVLLVVGGAIQGEPPDPADEPVQEVIDFYTDEGKIWAGALTEILAAAALVFFGGFLRKVLRAAEGEGHMLSAVVLAGTTIVATGLAFDATISIALVESAEEIEPGAVQALAALWHNDFAPIVLGSLVFILAAGVSILRHGALPRWLGWVAIVLAIAAGTPAGFFAFLAIGLWIAVVSVMLAMRERRGPGGAAPAAPAA